MKAKVTGVSAWQGTPTAGTLDIKYAARYADSSGNASVAHYTGTLDPVTKKWMDARDPTKELWIVVQGPDDPPAVRAEFYEVLSYGPARDVRTKFTRKLVSSDLDGLLFDYASNDPVPLPAGFGDAPLSMRAAQQLLDDGTVKLQAMDQALADTAQGQAAALAAEAARNTTWLTLNQSITQQQAVLTEQQADLTLSWELGAQLANSLNVDDYYQAGDEGDWPALNRAVTAARAAGKSVKGTLDKWYVIDRTLVADGVPLFNVNLKRRAEIKTTTTAPVAVGATTVTVTDASQFRVGQQITFTTGPNHDDGDIQHHPITAINGNTITFTYGARKAWGAGATVVTFYGMLQHQSKCLLVGCKFDGNRANNATYTAWEICWAVWFSGIRPRIIGCETLNDMADGLYGGGIAPYIKQYKGRDCGGGFIHLGLSYRATIEDIDCENGNISGVQGDANSGSAHKEGGITFSVDVYDTLIRRASIRKVRAGLGGLGGVDNSRTTLLDSVVEDALLTPIEWVDSATPNDPAKPWNRGLYGLRVERCKFLRCGKFSFGNNNSEWQPNTSGRDITLIDLDLISTLFEGRVPKNVVMRNVNIDATGHADAATSVACTFNSPNGLDWVGGSVRGGKWGLRVTSLNDASDATVQAARNWIIQNVDVYDQDTEAVGYYPTDAARTLMNGRFVNVTARNTKNVAAWTGFEGVKTGLVIQGGGVVSSVAGSKGVYMYDKAKVTAGPDGKPFRLDMPAGNTVLRLWGANNSVEGVQSPNGAVTNWTGTNPQTIYDVRDLNDKSITAPRAAGATLANLAEPATKPSIVEATPPPGGWPAGTFISPENYAATYGPSGIILTRQTPYELTYQIRASYQVTNAADIGRAYAVRFTVPAGWKVATVSVDTLSSSDGKIWPNGINDVNNVLITVTSTSVMHVLMRLTIVPA